MAAIKGANKLDSVERESSPGTSSRITQSAATGALRHLFGPAVLVGIICISILGVLLLSNTFPGHPTDSVDLIKNSYMGQKTDLSKLFEYQLKEYKDALLKLDTYLGLQALFVATTILVIIRRSDSLNLFGNSIPLSWLHFFLPVVLVYLWLASGFTEHELVWGRIRGVEIAKALEHPEYKTLFHDAGWIDGWLVAFVDKGPNTYSGIDPTFAVPTSVGLVIVLGTLTAAAHASPLALLSIGCRRYLTLPPKGCLILYYLLPLVPLIFLIASHVQFAYGGSNGNWHQLYVVGASVPLVGFLLWLSANVDKSSYPETLKCLRRARQVTVLGPMERSPLRDGPGGGQSSSVRTISLVGDSLSMSFFVSSLPLMLVRTRRSWRTNWFVSLPTQKGIGRSVLARLSAYGTITGTQHASVGAMVEGGKRRSILNHVVGTYHFSNQVDEVLLGRFPDILLIWIGNNDVGWRWRAASYTPELMIDWSKAFIYKYEVQLRRLIAGAMIDTEPAVLLVFGLTNFGSFFRARAEAETIHRTNSLVFPHLETAYKYFISMKPEYRAGMVELAALFNNELEAMCTRLKEQLAGTHVRLIYSNALSVTPMDSTTLLCSVDAWHPSIHGHCALADTAYPIILGQAQHLGWETADG